MRCSRQGVAALELSSGQSRLIDRSGGCRRKQQEQPASADVQPERIDFTVTEDVEQFCFFTRQQFGSMRRLGGGNSARPRSRRDGPGALRQRGDEFVSGEFHRIENPVRSDDAGVVAVILVHDREQHVAVGAGVRRQPHQKAGEVSAALQPVGLPGGFWMQGCVEH